MRLTRASILILLVCLLALAACDSDSPSTVSEGLPSTSPGLTQGPTVVVGANTSSVPPTAVPTATVIPRIKKGDSVTALAALEQLKADALAWQKDAQFVMLANVTPGQESRILGMALSDPDLTDLISNGTGANWVLLAASRSAEGIVVFDLDGDHTDLVASGKVPASLLTQLTGPGIAGVAMSNIDVSKLVDSSTMDTDSNGGASATLGVALISPARLGMASLFDQKNGQATPDLLYEVFSSQPSPTVSFYDALTGTRVRQVAHE